MGPQIAVYAAAYGNHVTVVESNSEALHSARQRLLGVAEKIAASDRNRFSMTDMRGAMGRVNFTQDLASTAGRSHLIFELVPESLELKEDFYEELSTVAHPQAIVCTGTSTMLPSTLAEFYARPERMMALHVFSDFWDFPCCEIMPHPGTDPQLVPEVAAFGRSLDLEVFALEGEWPGYMLNAIMIPGLLDAIGFLAEGRTDPLTMDEAWRTATGSDRGPFELLDTVGIVTVYNVLCHRAAEGHKSSARIADFVREEYLKKGRYGFSCRKGFLDYDAAGNIVR